MAQLFPWTYFYIMLYKILVPINSTNKIYLWYHAGMYGHWIYIHKFKYISMTFKIIVLAARGYKWGINV